MSESTSEQIAREYNEGYDAYKPFSNSSLLNPYNDGRLGSSMYWSEGHRDASVGIERRIAPKETT